jgi:hypothetical protein
MKLSTQSLQSWGNQKALVQGVAPGSDFEVSLSALQLKAGHVDGEVVV